MYRLLIVENEPSEAQELMSLLNRFSEERGVSFRTSWLKSAAEYLYAPEEYDLIFMDIDLPGISGMEAAQMLRVFDQATPLVFVTNLAQYALKGYEVDALDFLVKPLGYPSFKMHMEKALRAMERTSSESLAVQTRDGMRILRLHELEYVEVRNHNLSFHLTNGEKLASYGTLKGFEEQHPHPALIRLSSYCLANAQNICSVRGRDVAMESGAVLQISHGRKRAALDELASYLGGSR